MTGRALQKLETASYAPNLEWEELANDAMFPVFHYLSARSLDQLLKTGKFIKTVGSYIDENKSFERTYLGKDLDLEQIPQEPVDERCPAVVSDIPVFPFQQVMELLDPKWRTSSSIQEGQVIALMFKPWKTRTFDSRDYVIEENCTFRKAQNNFNEVIGTIAPESVNLQGTCVDKVIQSWEAKQIEKATFVDSHEEAVQAELKDGIYVNLGIGILRAAPTFLPDGIERFLQSENGILVMDQYPKPGRKGPDLINAGKETITVEQGASLLWSHESFGMIQYGKLDVAMLGALEVSIYGDLASSILQGKVERISGAINSVANPEKTKVVVTMLLQVQKSDHGLTAARNVVRLSSSSQFILLVSKMRTDIKKFGLFLLCLLEAANGLTATILADTNRDGVVDSLDLEAKNNWTADNGALFLANIVDTDRRCSLQITRQTADTALELCHDASDDVLRNPRYLAPLLTLPIHGLGPGAKASISIAEPAAAGKVRIFQRGPDDQWAFIKADHVFTAHEVEQGLQLGIDARDIRRPGGWNGYATVRFTVSDGPNSTTEDTVSLRVAPILTHHHVQPADRVFVTSFPSGVNGQFVKDLHANVDTIMPVQELRNASSDIWTQDFFETAYSSIPGPDGPVVLRIMLRTASLFRAAGRAVFSELRDGNVGAVNTGDGGAGTDATGNLETIPPYSYNGRRFPAGRIIMGRQGNVDPKILPLLQAQEVQDPLRLDTDWLLVGHVDEFLQFLPADNERGWVLIADDPLRGLELLQEAAANGQGAQRAFSRPKLPSDGRLCVPSLSVNQVLALDEFIDANEFAAERISANLDILKRETGITDDEILRLPAIFYNKDAGGCDTTSEVASASAEQNPLNIIEAASPPGTTVRRQSGGGFARQLFAFYPGIINGVVLNNSTVLAPNPWGPIVDGKDILLAEAEAVYAKIGYNVIWQDDFFSHHVLLGEIHCGTNTWRASNDIWCPSLVSVLAAIIPGCYGALTTKCTSLRHWPAEAAKSLNAMIRANAHSGAYAVFDMDNTAYRFDLEESLLPYLEERGILTRDHLDPSLRLIPFKDSGSYNETLFSFYYRLCEIDDVVCYEWVAQVFSGFTLRELKAYVDELMVYEGNISTSYYDGDVIVETQVSRPEPYRGQQELFNLLMQNGIDVYVITAALEELVRMVASDPRYGYNVPPENVIGVTLLLANESSLSTPTTARKQIANGDYDQQANLDLKLTPYLWTPATWMAGKHAAILTYIDQWKKPVLVAGDTPESDGYMLFHDVNVAKGGVRLWVNRREKYFEEINKMIAENKEAQEELGLEVMADKNWVFVKPEEIL
ncbi:Protein-arginine deiminase type-1 [Paramyrothecium foliicola]|nr:Protein-arginine deiminase type-1 [Paramyrothecium foliicola]